MVGRSLFRIEISVQRVAMIGSTEAVTVKMQLGKWHFKERTGCTSLGLNIFRMRVIILIILTKEKHCFRIFLNGALKCMGVRQQNVHNHYLGRRSAKEK